jgi:hypothetical protein
MISPKYPTGPVIYKEALVSFTGLVIYKEVSTR